jgi:DnaJ-class molecular chaperone
VNGRRCAGIYHSNLSFVWDKCQACKATGHIGRQVCGECNGMGWHLHE